jgi:hypothetical protein
MLLILQVIQPMKEWFYYAFMWLPALWSGECERLPMAGAEHGNVDFLRATGADQWGGYLVL